MTLCDDYIQRGLKGKVHQTKSVTEDELTEHGEHDTLFLLQELQNFVKNMFNACHVCMREEGNF